MPSLPGGWRSSAASPQSVASRIILPRSFCQREFWQNHQGRMIERPGVSSQSRFVASRNGGWQVVECSEPPVRPHRTELFCLTSFCQLDFWQNHQGRMIDRTRGSLLRLFVASRSLQRETGCRAAGTRCTRFDLLFLRLLCGPFLSSGLRNAQVFEAAADFSAFGIHVSRPDVELVPVVIAEQDDGVECQKCFNVGR